MTQVRKQGRDWLNPSQPPRWQDASYLRTMRSPKAWWNAVLSAVVLVAGGVGVLLFLEAIR